LLIWRPESRAQGAIVFEPVLDCATLEALTATRI
jgi:hypothetical protein